MTENVARIPSTALATDGFTGHEWHLEVEAECPEAVEAAPDGQFSCDEITHRTPNPAPSPPSLDSIIEAMLFIGGPPVTASSAMNCIRGLTETAFRESIDRLAKRYRDQRRPYAVRPRGDGYVLTIRPEYRVIQERLRGSPREARLSQAALDVLSLVAYRQPITKSECDATRGADTGSALRQLIRLGLISVNPTNRAYTTTSRFLDLFGLSSLQDLPRPDDSHS